MAKKITQTEAHALKRRVAELEKVLNNQRNAWVREWPEGVHLGSLQVSDTLYATLMVARKLKHAVVITLVNRNYIDFHALPIGGQ